MKHPASAREMTAKSKIAVARDFPYNRSGRAITIFCVGTKETGKLIETDPTVKAGLLKARLHPWITAKGVLASGQPTQVTKARVTGIRRW